MVPTVVEHEQETPIDSRDGGRWMVVIHNNETNSFEEVVSVLILATHCGFDEAYTETWEAHHYGKAPVHFGEKSTCDAAAAIISRIGVRTEVHPEWQE